MIKKYIFLLCVLTLCTSASAQFPMIKEGEKFDVKITKVTADPSGSVNITFFLRQKIDESYPYRNVGRAWGIGGMNHRHYKSNTQVEADFSMDVWVKGEINNALVVDTSEHKLLALCLPAIEEKFLFYDVPIEWLHPDVGQWDFRAEKFLSNGDKMKSNTKLITTYQNQGVYVVGNAATGEVSLAFLANNDFKWERIFIIDDLGMSYNYVRTPKNNRILKLEKTTTVAHIVPFTFSTSVKTIKAIWIEDNRHSFWRRDIPIQWVNEK